MIEFLTVYYKWARIYPKKYSIEKNDFAIEIIFPKINFNLCQYCEIIDFMVIFFAAFYEHNLKKVFSFVEI